MRGDTMRSFYLAAGGTLFTFLMTALGAAFVFCMRRGVSVRMNRICLGFSGGVMSAAAVFSLLLPAMEQTAGRFPALTIMTGFLLGTALMIALDAVLDRVCAQDGEETRCTTMLIAAVTLHNIPEGMAVGLAFVLAGQDRGLGLAAACALALGIGIQNIPEGAAVALPLRQGGMSRRRSFVLGALSGAVEPLAGILAVLLASCVRPAMPVLMATAAGTMMWVVMAEMLPRASVRRDGALAALLGYALMMALDIGLG